MQGKNLLYVLLFAIVSTSFGQQFKTNFRTLDTEDGLSQTSVNVLLEDTNGFIWVGTTDGLSKYDGYDFISYRNIRGDTTSLSNNFISHLVEDSQGNIWIGTEGGGVCKFNPKTETFQQYTKKEKKGKNDHNVIITMFIDSKDRIWAGHRKGLDLYKPESDLFESVLRSEPGNSNVHTYVIRAIAEDLHQNIWLGTESSGLLLFNAGTQEIEKSFEGDITSLICDDEGTLWISDRFEKSRRFNPDLNDHPIPISIKNDDDENLDGSYFFHSKTKSGKLIIQSKNEELFRFEPATRSIKSLFEIDVSSGMVVTNVLEDSAGSIWIGTQSKGIIYIGANSKPFQYRPNPESLFADNKIEPKIINEIFEDSKGYLWFYAENNGLVRINPKNGTKKTYPKLLIYLQKHFISLSLVQLKSIIEDDRNDLWIVVKDLGVIHLDPENGKFKLYDDRYELNENGLSFPAIQGILETKDGTIWMGSIYGHLIAFDPITDKSKKLYSYRDFNKNGILPLPAFRVNTLYEDLKGDLFIGFFDDGLYQLNRETDVFTKISYELDGAINSNTRGIHTLYQNTENILWIGTANGLFKYNTETKKSIVYGMAEGLPNTVIYDILDDEMGHLWLTTNNGISKFDPETLVFKNYDAADGLQQSEFNLQSSFKSKHTDLMYLRGTQGYNFFDPKAIKDNPYIPKIVITNFKRSSTEGDFIEIPGINYVEDISLAHKERDFSVEFASLDYTNPAKNQYAYKLEGYNEDWVEIGNKREMTFTSLSPGTYTLKLKGSNNDEIWNETGKSLKIEILPPWWGGWWAYVFYALLGMGLLFGIYRYRYNQLEAVRLRELDEVKKTMYTNITHEFRTPITVISGMNKELRAYFNGEQKEYFDLIDRNSKNMLYLVNQLLELRKMEIGKTTIDYIQGDIIPYLKYIKETFSTYAATKEISLHYISTVNQMVMDYDPDKMLVIVSNLLSNAIKYTSSGSDIYFQVELLHDHLQLRVADSGKGIPMKELPNIFDRFYKVIDKKDKEMDGIGIGLAVTKELVQLLNGEITVRSQVGKGSVFTVLLPILNTAPLENTTEQQDIKSKFEQYFHTKGANFEEKNLPIPLEDKPTVLVIEDNQDIIRYLVICLENQWNIKVASDGKEGIEKAIEIVPDIILSDLMMPNIDGYGVLDSVKNDERTSHIPVVILTAKADEVSRMETYKRGADSYLVKPFNKTELLLVLEKLVEQRKALQLRYKTQNSHLDPLEPQLQKEDSFILKIEELVLNEQTEASLGIEPLCRALSMSRTQLHNKVKALTGMSTSIFVRSIRLKKAKHLLEHTNKTISEIAYDVGFNHASYFTRSFTEEFGLPPSSLRK